jgi:hypothetical protein
MDFMPIVQGLVAGLTGWVEHLFRGPKKIMVHAACVDVCLGGRGVRMIRNETCVSITSIDCV